MTKKKLYIISGEASGDLHGANVMKEIYRSQPDTEIRFWGGDKMTTVGGTRAKHIKELAFMGFIEVLLNIRTIIRNMRFCKKDILAFQPDALLLIDYPGFNLRIAAWAKKKQHQSLLLHLPDCLGVERKKSRKNTTRCVSIICYSSFRKSILRKTQHRCYVCGQPTFRCYRTIQSCTN